MPYNSFNNDTIAAIATPLGLGGIGIVRMSGPRSREIAERIFRPKRPNVPFESHRLYLGRFVNPSSGEAVDEVLLSYMKAPNSYTGEDVVEINSHSGPILLSSILQIILQEGTRLADPGEFTFRAFLNGRIDLTQAEAIVDLVNAKSEKGLTLASRHITGELRIQIEQLRQKAIEILAHAEVAIDFPEEESGLLQREQTVHLLENELMEPIQGIIADHNRRKIWIEGVRTVIAGRVNAGKSSLLNRLLNEQRAIVSPFPGTTRDVIESTVYIEGVPFRLMDTAGIRKVRGRVEKIGIHLSEKTLSQADLALILMDQSRPLHGDDINIIDRAPKDRSLIVINKIDLLSKLDENELEKAIHGLPVLRISALKGEGIPILCKAMREMAVESDFDTAIQSFAPNQRQKTSLQAALNHFKNAVISIREDLPLEIIALDLKDGLDSLSDIIGETANEEIYDRIFSEFCIGK